MKKKIYVVHDAKTETYGLPMFQHNRGHAIRSFSEQCNNPESLLYKYAEDFTLFEIGSYNEEKGILTPAQIHHPVGKALDFKKVQITENHRKVIEEVKAEGTI